MFSYNAHGELLWFWVMVQRYALSYWIQCVHCSGKIVGVLNKNVLHAVSIPFKAWYVVVQ